MMDGPYKISIRATRKIATSAVKGALLVSVVFFVFLAISYNTTRVAFAVDGSAGGGGSGTGGGTGTDGGTGGTDTGLGGFSVDFGGLDTGLSGGLGGIGPGIDMGFGGGGLGALGGVDMHCNGWCDIDHGSWGGSPTGSPTGAPVWPTCPDGSPAPAWQSCGSDNSASVCSDTPLPCPTPPPTCPDGSLQQKTIKCVWANFGCTTTYIPCTTQTTPTAPTTPTTPTPTTPTGTITAIGCAVSAAGTCPVATSWNVQNSTFNGTVFSEVHVVDNATGLYYTGSAVTGTSFIQDATSATPSYSFALPVGTYTFDLYGQSNGSYVYLNTATASVNALPASCPANTPYVDSNATNIKAYCDSVNGPPTTGYTYPSGISCNAASGWKPYGPSCTAPSCTCTYVTSTAATTWTTYCTGGADQNGNNWQWWQYDSSTPPNYRPLPSGTAPPAGKTCAAPAPPTASLSATPSTIAAGDSSTLTWSSTNADSCVFADSTGTVRARSGTRLVNPSTTSTYSVTCKNSTRTSAPAQATVTVTKPTVSITATPTRVVSGGTTTVSWTATAVTDCAITRNSTAWKTGLTAGTSHKVTGSSPDTITGQTVYKITCNDLSATAQADSVVVNVGNQGFSEF